MDDTRNQIGELTGSIARDNHLANGMRERIGGTQEGRIFTLFPVISPKLSC